MYSDVPLAPTGLRVMETDAGRINLAWDMPKSDGGSAIIGYIIEICRSGSTTGWTTGARVDGSHLSAELTGLSENDLYFVRIFSENQAGVCKKPCEISEPISAKRPLREWKSLFCSFGSLSYKLTSCCMQARYSRATSVSLLIWLKTADKR